jgi:cytochrome c biogenesis protein CcdA
MVLMALQVWGIFNFVPSSYAVSKNKKVGYIGAFVAGILGGLFSSPCSTPVLVVILAVVAKEGSLLYGIILLLLYSIGHSVLVIIGGTSTSTLRKITNSNNYGMLSNTLKVITGLIILALGFYMFYLGF